MKERAGLFRESRLGCQESAASARHCGYAVPTSTCGVRREPCTVDRPTLVQTPPRFLDEFLALVPRAAPYRACLEALVADLQARGAVACLRYDFEQSVVERSDRGILIRLFAGRAPGDL